MPGRAGGWHAPWLASLPSPAYKRQDLASGMPLQKQFQLVSVMTFNPGLGHTSRCISKGKLTETALK